MAQITGELKGTLSSGVGTIEWKMDEVLNALLASRGALLLDQPPV